VDRIEKTKLYLVWLSCKDFESLKDDRNRKLLEQVWKKIKNDMQFYFKGYSVSLQSIIAKFQIIKLTLDPRVPFGYDPQTHSLIYNLWKLFFTLPADESFCIPKPAWQMAGGLIHEHDHYTFLKEHEMIGKPEEAQKEFVKKFVFETEKRAFSSELGFYESCRSIMPSYQTYAVTVKKWTKEGRPIQKDIKPISLSKEDALASLDSAITQLKDVVKRIESGEDYEDFSADQSIMDCEKMAQCLSLQIKLDKKREDYPKIEIKM